MTPRYHTVLLDFDHTLFDSDASERGAFAQTLKAHNVTPTAGLLQQYQKINLRLWKDVEIGRLKATDVKQLRFARFIEEAKLIANPEQMAEHYVTALAQHGNLYPGALDLLQKLATRVRLGLITNGLSEVQRTRLERLDIAQYFQAIVISGEVGIAKPDPKIFDIAFTMLKCPAKAGSLMIGDSLASDIKGGNSFGIDTCWYNPKKRKNTSEITPTYAISSLSEAGQIASATT